MIPTVRTILGAQGGVASTAQILAAGVSRFQLRRLVQNGHLVRLRRGVIVDPAVWHAAPQWERHVIRARGLMLGPAGAPGSPIALSHHSALTLLRIPVHGVDDRVHVVRTDGRRGQSDGFVQCHAPVAPELVRRAGAASPGTEDPGSDSPQLDVGQPVRAVCPALALLQVAATFGVESGLVSADAALRRGLVTREELEGLVRSRRLGNGAANARTVVEHADPGSESPGETRCRWLMHVLGLPRPVLQAVVRDHRGQFIARVDFLCEAERTIVEFDGLVKYTDRQVLVAGKAREEALRSLGYSVVRITWKDLAHPQRVLAKVLGGFRAAAAA